MIPWHVLIKPQLPSLEVMLAIAVPQAIKARGEGYRPLDALALGNHHDVGMAHLYLDYRAYFTFNSDK